MDNLTHQDHAHLIAESIMNGQHKQAMDQWSRALFDACAIESLAADLRDDLADDDALIRFLIKIIDKTN